MHVKRLLDTLDLVYPVPSDDSKLRFRIEIYGSIGGDKILLTARVFRYDGYSVEPIWKPQKLDLEQTAVEETWAVVDSMFDDLPLVSQTSEAAASEVIGILRKQFGS
jgi:nitric oxide synthase oxygenase domain/subunit